MYYISTVLEFDETGTLLVVLEPYTAVMTQYIEQKPVLLAIDCIIFGFDGLNIKLLLIQRGFEPEKGKWSLMGGFLQPSEVLDEAASRILKQLTGLEGVYMEQLHTFSELGMLFQHVIGQQAVKQHLVDMVAQNRLSHALLFLGREGSGALPLAIALPGMSACCLPKLQCGSVAF
jgi:hypothetical protein